MASLEAGPHERQPKMLKGELESNTRKPRDLVKKRLSESLKKGQLTLHHSKMKKGDDVADDEDSDVVRTCVSQDQVTATLCIEELFLRTQYI
jgi:hypothetical protein